MATSYTALLGLALPVTGELQGTWGDTVNNQLTSLLDTAVAGTTTLSTDADVTLSDTDGAANQARQAIILWTANGTVTRNITAPAQSKTYVVINASAGTQSIVIRGAGPTTGVTLVKGEYAVVAWDGSDFVKVTGSNGTSNFTTVNTTNLEVSNLKAKDGTSAGSIANSTGVVTLASAVLTTADINGGTIDGTAIGGTTRAAGNFTQLNSNGNTTLGDAAADSLVVNATIQSNLVFTDNTYDIGASGATRPRNLYVANNADIGSQVSTTNIIGSNLSITNIKANDGSASASIANSTGIMTIASAVLTTADINGGTMDNVTIGGSTPAAGSFTNVNATTVDATNLEVANLKAQDGTAAATIANSTGIITVSTQLQVDNLNLSTNTLSSTNANGNILLTPNGTGRTTVTNLSATSPRFTTSINDSSGNELFLLTATASAVNEVTLANAATGNAPTFTASGGDTNIDLVLAAKGTGQVKETWSSANWALASQYDIGTNANQIPLNQYLGTMAFQDASYVSVIEIDAGTVNATTILEQGKPVVTNADVGTLPNQIPLNQYLGAMAYQDSVSSGLEPGGGITLGSGTICQGTFSNMDGVKRATIILDLTGLSDGGTAGDIIGSTSTSIDSTKQPAYIAQLPVAFTVLGGRMTCLETPAGGGTDIDLYSATEGTGVQDSAITALTETQIVNGGSQTVGTVSYFSADPAASSYLYMVSQGTGAAAYTAGRFLIEIFGV